ncbi:DNA-binding protein [Candidatus Pacearchaeota archaeon]|nr:DNA-binding protein [Candidatus Pacearchaeota archaeon]|tara:strand:- start:1113 stop:1439 length:327 start_codon:yes stop_codon:yes gene_type:complete
MAEENKTLDLNPGKEQKGENNIVFVGSKPLINYIRSVTIQFKRENSQEVVIKSRGKFISKAVDIAEVARRNLEDLKIAVKDIKINSESFQTAEKKTNISTMDITLAKQ